MAFALNLKNGFPEMFAATKPSNKAKGGAIKPEMQTNINMAKINCCTLILILKKGKVFLGMISG